jgi:hypothetical protein
MEPLWQPKPVTPIQLDPSILDVVPDSSCEFAGKLIERPNVRQCTVDGKGYGCWFHNTPNEYKNCPLRTRFFKNLTTEAQRRLQYAEN